jgi:hypothetical protein
MVRGRLAAHLRARRADAAGRCRRAGDRPGQGLQRGRDRPRRTRPSAPRRASTRIFRTPFRDTLPTNAPGLPEGRTPGPCDTLWACNGRKDAAPYLSAPEDGGALRSDPRRRQDVNEIGFEDKKGRKPGPPRTDGCSGRFGERSPLSPGIGFAPGRCSHLMRPGHLPRHEPRSRPQDIPPSWPPGAIPMRRQGLATSRRAARHGCSDVAE